VVLGEDEAKQLLLPMDTGNNSKISKEEEVMTMEAEFDRPVKGKSGGVGRRGTNSIEIACNNPLSASMI
jgi:hypothetical protein